MGKHKHGRGRTEGRLKRRIRQMAAAVGLAALALAVAAPSTHAQTAGTADALRTGSVTGLPIPRFVSLKADRVNVRRGPSRSHQVDWVLLKAGLPVEITAEFENWRRIRDHAGDEGWVFHTLLSGRRTALFAPWAADGELIDIKRRPEDGAPTVARVGPRVMGDVARCDNNWCEVELEQATGWTRQDTLWGVYPGEAVK
jgi:SH3-like domain-containing protein